MLLLLEGIVRNLVQSTTPTPLMGFQGTTHSKSARLEIFDKKFRRNQVGGDEIWKLDSDVMSPKAALPLLKHSVPQALSYT